MTAGDLYGHGESVPAEFTFRASGGKSIKDGTAYIKEVHGNAVVWNQMFKIEVPNITSNGIKLTLQQDNSIKSAGTFTESYINFGQFHANEVGHKYLFTLKCSSANLDGKRFALLNRGENTHTIVGGFSYIFHTNSTPTQGRYIGIDYLTIGDSIDATLYINQYDLTQMFGLGNEPTTIEDFYKLLPIGVDLNAYNEGEVIPFNAQGIKSVGDNAWDEQWENGYINDQGVNGSSSAEIRSKNYIPVLPNEQYYFPYYLGNKYGQSGSLSMRVLFFDKDKRVVEAKTTYTNWAESKWIMTTPSNCHYIRFYTNIGGGTYNHDITISLYHSGWKAEVDNTYKPYWQDILPLPIIRKYFPDGMKKAGAVHDEIRYNKASGKWEAVQRLGSVDMGKLSWNYGQPSDNYPYGYFYKTIDEKEYGHNLLCVKYTTLNSASPFSIDKNIFGANGNKIVYIIDSAYTDTASFKADMDGVILYYELAEPIVTELGEELEMDYKVADFGTEEIIGDQPSAAFKGRTIYQFNAVDQIRENYNEIEKIKAALAKAGISIDL